MQGLIKAIGAIAATVALAAPAMAAGKAPVVQPGLWELTKTGDLAGWIRLQMSEMEAELKNLPADQQAAIRATIDAQIESFKLPEKSCVSADDAASFWQDQLTADSCQRTLEWTAAGSGVMNATCGDGRTSKTLITVRSADDFSMTSIGSLAQGKPIEFTMTLRRLGSDCGKVKP